MLAHAGTISHVCRAPLPHWLRITYRTGDLVSGDTKCSSSHNHPPTSSSRYRDCHLTTDRHLEEQLWGNYVRAMAPHSWQHLTVLLRCDYRCHRISTRLLRESQYLVRTLPLHCAPCSFSKCPKDVVVGYARIQQGGCGGACVTSCESHRIRLSSMSRLLGRRPIGNRRVWYCIASRTSSTIDRMWIRLNRNFACSSTSS